MKFFRKRKIQFTDRSHPFWGIVSAIIGIVSVVIMLSLFIGSGTQGGTAGISYGVLGTLNMMGSLVGFILGIRCYQKEDFYHLYPNIGVALNAIVTLLYMVLYGIGMS